MKKILFITHNTSRTGAPLVMLYIMQWLKINKPEYQIDCVTLSGGDLDSEFIKVSDNFYDLSPPHKLNLFPQKILYKSIGSSIKEKHQKQIIKAIKSQNYHLVYANTVASLDWGCRIKKELQNTKLILHLHELDFVIKTLSPNFSNYINKVDAWICASKLVMKNLVDNYGVSSEKVTTVYAFSKVNSSTPNFVKPNQSPFVVGGSGLVSRRKGYDLFISVAKEVKRQAPNLDIVFNWIGKFPRKGTNLEVELDIKKANLSGIVNFKGEEENPFESFNLFDLFLMTSREDPFPLVCIEVGSLGKPILCFEGATGTEEILKSGGGKIIPYLSIFDMASKVIEYVNDKDMLQSDGLLAKEKFKEFNIETQAPKIHDVLNLILEDE